MLASTNTKKLIELIGSPFVNHKAWNLPSDKLLLQVYEKAFYDRVAPLYLHKYRREGWLSELENHYIFVLKRESMTRTVLTDLAANLNDWNEHGYVIFKSIKPYPAIPNDTDVLIFGGKKEFDSGLMHLYNCGYIFHEWAPLQTTLYDPRGKGKIGIGKKGGTYYIDVYCEISTDYVCYLNEKAIKPHVIVKKINGIDVRLVKSVPELAIILFHSVFPERTFNLEHFYLTLYYLADSKFDINSFVLFNEKNKMVYAVRSNLSLIEKLHEEHFGFIPKRIIELLDHWGRNEREVQRFTNTGMETPYLFSPKVFWTTCINKLRDPSFTRGLFSQVLHMLNPIFFIDVVKSLKNRMSERGTYHLE